MPTDCQSDSRLTRPKICHFCLLLACLEIWQHPLLRVHAIQGDPEGEFIEGPHCRLHDIMVYVFAWLEILLHPLLRVHVASLNGAKEAKEIT